MKTNATYPEKHKTIIFDGHNLDKLTLPELDSLEKFINEEMTKTDQQWLKSGPALATVTQEHIYLKTIDMYTEMKEVVAFARIEKFKEIFPFPLTLPVNKKK